MSKVHDSFEGAQRTSQSMLEAFSKKFSAEELTALNAKRNLDPRFQIFPDIHLTPEITLSLTTDRLGTPRAQTIYRMSGEKLLEDNNVAIASQVAKRMGIIITPLEVSDGMAFTADVAQVGLALQKNRYSLRPTEEGIPIATFHNYNPALKPGLGRQPG